MGVNRICKREISYLHHLFFQPADSLSCLGKLGSRGGFHVLPHASQLRILALQQAMRSSLQSNVGVSTLETDRGGDFSGD